MKAYFHRRSASSRMTVCISYACSIPINEQDSEQAAPTAVSRDVWALCRKDKAEDLKKLLSDPNVDSDLFDKPIGPGIWLTPLHYACDTGSWNAVKVLVEATVVPQRSGQRSAGSSRSSRASSSRYTGSSSAVKLVSSFFLAQQAVFQSFSWL